MKASSIPKGQLAALLLNMVTILKCSKARYIASPLKGQLAALLLKDC